MKYGVFIFPTDTSIRPDHLAIEVEARGFESPWFPEHSHIPISRETAWGGQKDAPPLPEHNWHTHDQFVALAYVASATETLKPGTGITLVAPARSKLDGERSCVVGSSLGRPGDIWRWIRVEQGGDGPPRDPVHG